MNRIDSFFQQRRKAFIPYVTAGFPSVGDTVGIMNVLRDQGADIIELGYPFSDPTADGPVIQASSQAALARGFRRADYFAAIRAFRRDDDRTPLVVFGYFNPIHHAGTREFVATARDAGADAFLVVDVPFEEQGDLRPFLDECGLHLIQLVAPTTTEARCRRILATATGFVYQISVRGVTGARQELAADVGPMLARTKALTPLPVVLGFGVSTAAQAAQAAALADGVVVGSAVVKCLSNHEQGYRQPLTALARDLAEAVHGAG